MWCVWLLIFKALNGLAPKYISDLLTWYVPSRPLRSADGALLVTLRSRLVTKGDQAFAIRAPTLWNSLPAELRHTNSLASLKSLLKTFLFVKAFGNVWYVLITVFTPINWCYFILFLSLFYSCAFYCPIITIIVHLLLLLCTSAFTSLFLFAYFICLVGFIFLCKALCNIVKKSAI